jgi:hypothetical protein
VLHRPAPKLADDEAGSLGRAMDIVWLMREQFKPLEPDTLAVGDGFPSVEWLVYVRLDKYHQKVVRTRLGALFRYSSTSRCASTWCASSPTSASAPSRARSC